MRVVFNRPYRLFMNGDRPRGAFVVIERFGYKPSFFGSVIEYEERLRESLETGEPRLSKREEGTVL